VPDIDTGAAGRPLPSPPVPVACSVYIAIGGALVGATLMAIAIGLATLR
jgi:hypothetical protein